MLSVSSFFPLGLIFVYYSPFYSSLPSQAEDSFAPKLIAGLLGVKYELSTVIDWG